MALWVAFEGDSITDPAYYPLYPNKWPEKVQIRFIPSYPGQNFAVAGSTVADASPTMNSRAASVDATYSGANPVNALCILIGHNDIVISGNTAASFVAKLKTYCLARLAVGWKVVLCTVLPSTIPGFNAVRNSANALIRADTSFYSALVDLALNTDIGLDSSANNTLYFNDGTHVTPSGHDIIAGLVTPVLATFGGTLAVQGTGVVKPAGPLTPNVSHPLCPDLAVVAFEGSGQPANIGKQTTAGVLTAAGSQLAGTTTWATRSGFGKVIVLDGQTRIGYGTGTFLSGRSKFTVGVAFNPGTFTQTGAFFSKQAAYLSGDYYSVGLTNDSGFGPIFYFLIGTAGGNSVAVEYFVQTSGRPLGMQIWFIDFDNSRGANDQVRFYLGQVLQGVTIRANLGATTVASPAGQAIEIGQGTGSFDAPQRMLGPNIAPFAGVMTDLGWLYVWDNKILVDQDRADVLTNPYLWTNETLPVVGLSAPTPNAYEKTPTQVPKPGALLLQRTAASLASPFPVTVAITGTAEAGVDYVPIATTQTIPAGQASLSIPIVPILRAAFDFAKTVIVTIQSNAAYGVAVAAATIRLTEFEFDGYMGLKGCASPNVGLNGKWRLELVNNRYLPVSPEGNYTWLLGCQTLDSPDGVFTFFLNVYYTGQGSGGVPFFQWVPHATARLKDWGFNMIGELASVKFWPVNTNFAPPKQTSLPYCYLMDMAHYTAVHSIPDIYDHVNVPNPGPMNAGFGIYNGDLADAFHPNFPAAVTALVTDNRIDNGPLVTPDPQNSAANQKWLIYVTVDDSDFQRGLKHASQEHIGWICAVCDPVIYSKQALRDFLKTRYHNNISELNAAWGTGGFYTTFESDGGWPRNSTGGHGFLDEDGTATWLRGNTGFHNAYWLSDFPATIRTDLDNFMTVWLARYFGLVKAAVNAFLPGTLMCSNDGIGLWDGSKPVVEQFWTQNVDIIIWNWVHPSDCYNLVDQQWNHIPKPMIAYTVFESLLDSALAANINDPTANWDRINNVPDGNWNFPTQAARGAAYKNFLQNLWNARTAGGIYPWIGSDWWRYPDGQGGEAANFGLVTGYNNAFDGIHDTTTPGTSDAYATGLTPNPEAANYGDAITGIKDGNYQMYYNVMQWVSGIVPVSQPSQEALPAGSGAGFS